MILAEHSDAHGLSWPSQRTLAEEVECDHRTVRRHLDQLRDGGLVTWTPGAGRGSNRYQLTMPEAAPKGSRRGPVVRHHGASQATSGAPVVGQPGASLEPDESTVVGRSDASLQDDQTGRSEAPGDRSEALDLRSAATRASDQHKQKQNRTTLEPREIEPTAAPQQYARGGGEHVAPAELDRTATGAPAFVIVAAWVERNPGVANGHRRELSKAVDALLAQGSVDRALIPAALDRAHEPHWRNPAKALPMAYEDVRRAAAAAAQPSATATPGTARTRSNAFLALRKGDPR